MNGKKLIKGTVLTMLCAAMLYMNSTVSKAYQVVVKGDSTRVRNTASTESDVMTTVKKGDKLEVVSEEQGSDGKTWYKVSINNVSGYVRSDTVEKATEENTQTAEVKPVEASSSSVVEPMTSQAATVKMDDVNVRANASTNGKVVAKLKNGAAVTLTGTTSDGSGKKWYQVNFINNGANVTGYIREDFVEPGEVMEPQSEESTEGADGELANMYGDMPTEDEAANNDYELFYEADQEGVDTWYIHDNIAQKRYKLEQLMQADEINLQNMEVMNKEVNRLKIVLLIVVVLLVLALLAAGFLGFKYHELRDDDEDEEEYRPTSPIRRTERQQTSAGKRKEAQRGEDRNNRGVPVRRNDAGMLKRPTNGQGRPERNDAGNRNVKTARPGAGVQIKQNAGAGRSAQPVPQNKKPQPPSDIETQRKNGRPDVEWKSKNFLAGEEDGMDYSFINGEEE